MIREALQDAGWQIIAANELSQIRQLIREEKIFLLLLCIDSADEDCLNIIQYIKENHPFTETIVISKRSNLATAFSVMQAGAYDFLLKSQNITEYIPIIDSVYKDVWKRYKKSKIKPSKITSTFPIDYLPPIIGEHPKIKEILEIISKVAPTDATVLILGETGVGKELIAQTIHRYSLRKDKPFLTFSCGACPETLIENELFGHEKGAYTDATKIKYGLFEEANGGSIFLDEIGELTPPMQVKLLRVLETGKFRRLGGTNEIRTDVRMICATNKCLYEEVKNGNFRADLYYRLAVVTIYIPPLRERKEDIPLLVEHFLNIYNRYIKTPKKISNQALKILMEYDWPGNVRELKHCIERLVIMTDAEIIKPRDVIMSLPNIHSITNGLISELAKPFGESNMKSHLSLEELEKRYIRYIYQSTGKNIYKTVEILCITVESLCEKLRNYHIIEPQTDEIEK